MPTGFTQLSLCNRALDLIGQFPLASLSDDSAYARWLTRNFAPEVRSELEANVWGFACLLQELTADPAAPAFRWDYSYSLPTGWLAVVPPTENGERHGRPVDYDIRGDKLMTDASSPLRVEIVFDTQDPSEWSSLFADLIAARLALGLANKFVKQPAVIRSVQQAVALAEARADDANARTGSIPPVDQYDIIRARV